MYNQEKDFDNDIMDIDEFQQKIRLKPDFYIHLTFQQLTRVFDGDVSDTEAFNKYIHLVGHLEVLCKANNLNSTEYDKKIDKIKKDAEEKFNAQMEREGYIAREKVGILMKNVFSNGKVSGSVSLFTNADGSTSRQNETHERIQAKKLLLEQGQTEDEKKNKDSNI